MGTEVRVLHLPIWETRCHVRQLKQQASAGKSSRTERAQRGCSWLNEQELSASRHRCHRTARLSSPPYLTPPQHGGKGCPRQRA